MQDPLCLILICIPLVAGAIAIFFAFQLMRQYRLPFVSSFFYYLVFLYIFAAYSLIGSGILEHLFIHMRTDPDTIYSARLFAILLGIPLLVLSKYMLLRCMAELLLKKVSIVFTIIYFSVAVVAFILYGIFVVRLTRFEIGEYQVLVAVQRWVFTGLMAGIYTTAFLISLFLSGKLVQHERSFARVFGLWYFLFMILTCSSFLLDEVHEVVPYIFVIIFLSWHLIPILFLNLYLEKYHGQTASVREDFEDLLTSFSEEFEISKREREVIQLICKGLSNQEISDALFISLQTVKDHIHRIFVKTGVKNRVQLTNLIRSR
jgi:DNA-binding CsgD family transcriptional regulator